MKQLRALLSDLVERRLWPVALALVVALAAVPVVLGRGGDAPPAATPGAATADAGAGSDAAQNAEVTLDTRTPAEHAVADRVRSPFKAPKIKITKTDAPAAAATPPAATTTSGSSGASPAGSADTGSTTSGSSGASTTGAGTGSTTTTTTPKTPTTTKPKTTTTATAEDADDTYHVSVRFGVDAGQLQTIRDVARLTPVPSASDPFFVYLGVLTTQTTNEKRAVFIVTSDATPNGEGACHPTKQDCQSVELTVGQTAFFDYTGADGKVTQHVLQLAAIHKTAVKADAKAAAAFARHSATGAELVRDAATRNVRAAAGARAYRYLPAVGLLSRARRKHVTAKAAAVDGLVPGLALLGRKHQPGLPVWHSPEQP